MSNAGMFEIKKWIDLKNDTCICICMYTYLYMCVCVCVCMQVSRLVCLTVCLFLFLLILLPSYSSSFLFLFLLILIPWTKLSSKFTSKAPRLFNRFCVAPFGHNRQFRSLCFYCLKFRKKSFSVCTLTNLISLV